MPLVRSRTALPRLVVFLFSKGCGATWFKLLPPQNSLTITPIIELEQRQKRVESQSGVKYHGRS